MSVDYIEILHRFSGCCLFAQRNTCVLFWVLTLLRQNNIWTAFLTLLLKPFILTISNRKSVSLNMNNDHTNQQRCVWPDINRQELLILVIFLVKKCEGTENYILINYFSYFSFMNPPLISILYCGIVLPCQWVTTL